MSLLDEMGGSLEDWIDDPDQLREDYIEDNDIDEENIKRSEKMSCLMDGGRKVGVTHLCRKT